MYKFKTNNENMIIYIAKINDENENESGFIATEIPSPPYVVNKIGQVYYTDEKGFWYVYADIQKTEAELNTERLQALEQSNAEMMNLITMMATPTV